MLDKIKNYTNNDKALCEITSDGGCMSQASYEGIWQEIQFILGRHVGSDIAESIYEKEALRAMEGLGWKEYRNEIKIKPSISIGSNRFLEPDIVIKDNNVPVIVIEVKKPSFDMFSDNASDQLQSYMRQTRAEIGFLIGKEIIVYYDGKLNDLEKPIQLLRIRFSPIDEYGLQFTKLFNKDSFQRKEYENLAKERLKELKKYYTSNKLIEILKSEETIVNILEFLKNRFSEFDSDTMSLALSQIEIKILNKNDTIREPIGIIRGQIAPNTPHRPRVPRPVIKENRLIIPNKEYLLSELLKYDWSVLSNTKPRLFIIEFKTYDVLDWTELCVNFIHWLIEKGYLSKNKMPIPNAAQRGKNFINIVPEHNITTRDGLWKRVGDYYIDTKYRAKHHVENMAFVFEYLNISLPAIKIVF